MELFPQPWVKWIYMPNLASVVTSVTIVETTDEEARQRYELLFSCPFILEIVTTSFTDMRLNT